MSIGILRIKFHIPGCHSLKEKRRHIRPMLERLRREFNISAAEMNYHDVWQTAEISLVTISTKTSYTQSSLQKAVTWIEAHFPDLIIESEDLELI